MTIIASRELVEVGPTATRLQVEILAPVESGDMEWTCPFRIRGYDGSTMDEAHGVDALQALIMALEGVRCALERTGSKYTWLGGEEGDTGIPMFLPQYYGLQFYLDLERMVSERVDEFAEKVMLVPKQRNEGYDL